MGIVNSLKNKQEFKQYIYLIRRNFISRMDTKGNQELITNYNRILKICDFLLCSIDKFTIEELQDVCKIFDIASLAHEPVSSAKTSEEVDKDFQIFNDCLDQTEQYLRTIHGLEITNSSPTDMMFRNRIQIYRLEEKIENNIIKFNNYIEFYNKNETPDYQLTTVKCEYEIQVQKLTMLLESCRLLKKDLDNLNAPDVAKINAIEAKIEKISDLQNEILKLIKIEKIEALLKEAKDVDIQVDSFVKSV